MQTYSGKNEIYEVEVVFQILDDIEHMPEGYSKTSGHIIFDVKMNFICKGRWVKDGHLTPDLKNSKYAGVVSRESVRILS